MTKRAVFDVVEFKADTDGRGTFVADVAVYGNVDRQGDRIVPGAFDNSLARWRKAGDPIPVIWTHNWQDPHAYIGEADPARVQTEGRSLRVPGKNDLDDPFAAKVHHLLKSRRVRQWSFAYDVIKERTAEDGVNELVELDLIEIGPTLKGANPMTDTVDVKGDELVPEAEEVEAANIGTEVVAGPATFNTTTANVTVTNGDHDDEGHEKGGRGPATDSSTWDAGPEAEEVEAVEPKTEDFGSNGDHDENDDEGHEKGGRGPATDSSTWDAGAAMASAQTAADYRAICAGERSTGEPDERQHWALPHHKSPGSPANAAGVRAARARLGQTEGLINAEAARRHLFEAHKLPSETASADPAAVKAEAIVRLRGLRDWADEQLKALDPEISEAESATLSLDAQIEKLRHELTV